MYLILVLILISRLNRHQVCIFLPPDLINKLPGEIATEKPSYLLKYSSLPHKPISMKNLNSL